MKDADRGMVKYAPYQSLVEQAKYLAAMRKQRSYVEKRHLSQDVAAEINEILIHYDGEEVVLEYWRQGQVIMVEGTILRIDTYSKSLCIGEHRIPFQDLQSLKRKTASLRENAVLDDTFCFD